MKKYTLAVVSVLTLLLKSCMASKEAKKTAKNYYKNREIEKIYRPRNSFE